MIIKRRCAKKGNTFIFTTVEVRSGTHTKVGVFLSTGAGELTKQVRKLAGKFMGSTNERLINGKHRKEYPVFKDGLINISGTRSPVVHSRHTKTLTEDTC